MAGEEPKGFQEAQEQARHYAGDQDKTNHMLAEATAKANHKKSSLKDVWDHLMVLIRMVSATMAGTYNKLPSKTLVLALGAVIYFLNPFDLVPDFLPGVGYLDDMTVIAYVIKSIKADLERFLDWEKSKK